MVVNVGKLVLAAAALMIAPLAGCGHDGGESNNSSPKFYIRTAADLNAVRQNLSGNYKLMNDISLADYDTGSGWQPIGTLSAAFTGRFNGNGHKITGLFIDRPTEDFVGLFGCIGGIGGGCSISDLGVEIADGGVTGGLYAGGIVGVTIGSDVTPNSTIINCYSTGNITAVITILRSSVGGIAGSLSSCAITNCFSTGNITADLNGFSGGIAGEAFVSTVTNCYSTGNVSAPDGDCGGIVGDLANTSTITGCYSTGIISSFSSSFPYSDDAGGIAGVVRNGSAITNCAAINPAINGHNRAGRIAAVGYVDSISDSGPVSGPVTITNNFALTGMKTAGAAQFDVSDTRLYGVDKTNAQLQTQSTYSDAVKGDGWGGLGWKFGNDDDNPWKMVEGGYPILYRQ